MFTVRIPKDKVLQLLDMLRHDRAYGCCEEKDAYKFDLLYFTKDWWKQTGYVPEVVEERKLTGSERQDAQARAMGFTVGLLFAQQVLGSRGVD